jgi:3-methyladenine DNA glycosylase AlkD
MTSATRSKTPAYIADHIRHILKDGASAPHTAEVERFFKHEIQSHGWYMADLRKLARRMSRATIHDMGLEFLVRVADRLFRGNVLEERIMAVLLLETSTADFGDKEFNLFESWLDRISSWADHDALSHYLIAPMILAEPKCAQTAIRWARSSDPWHRRAACVALVKAARKRQLADEIKRVSEMLLDDENLMVQKGLGWLLREWAKADAANAVAHLMTIRERAPRLVLRTACETLPAMEKAMILGASPQNRFAADLR